MVFLKNKPFLTIRNHNPERQVAVNGPLQAGGSSDPARSSANGTPESP